MRQRIEQALGRWGRFVALNPGRVIVAVLLATGLLATQLQHFYLDASSEGFFHEDDPVRVRIDALRETFGRDTAIIVALRPGDGIFDRAFLEELRTLHAEIEDEVPLLVEVTSLINARETVGHAEGLDVGELLEDWPETDEELRAIEARARANPLYQNNLISSDGRSTAIAIETEAYSVNEDFDALAGFEDDALAESTDEERAAEPRTALTGEEDGRIVAALEQVLERHRSDDLEIYLAGMPAFSSVLADRMGSDMGRFSGLSIALVALFLALLFRRLAAVVLPLFTVVLSVVATLSLMGAVGIPMMPPTQIIPSFLLAVGIGGAVHLLAIFYQARRRGEDKVDSIAFALSHSGLPIVMTSLTTAGGLLSFIPAALRPISHFGAITPVGVLLSLFYVLTLLPALMAVVPMRSSVAKHDDTFSQRLLVGAGNFSTRRAPLVLAAWGLLIVVSGVGILRVTLGHNMLEWFPEREPMWQATHFVNDEFGGATTFELLLSSGVENGLHEPELLRKLERVQLHAENFEHLGIQGSKVISIVDVVKETHRALNENRPDFYVIPDERKLVAQELLLFENSGSDDVEDLVTSQFDTGRLTVRVPFVDGAYYMPYIDRFVPAVEAIVGPDVDVELTGMLRLFGNTIRAALDTMLRSYITAIIVITALMILLIGNLRMGFLSMIPNLAPVVFALGLMGWLGVPLDMFTLMVGAIVIGLAVDDTIHFMHNFRREFERTADVEESVRRTLRGTGQALLFTSCVLATGFLVYTQAYMIHLFAFGILTSGAIVVAFLADLTLAPALVATVMKPDAVEPGEADG